MTNPNDESTLTSASANTPVPTEHDIKELDDVVLMKFAQIYADNTAINDSLYKEPSCHSDLSGSCSDSDVGDQACGDNVPDEVTCGEDDISLADKSFEIVTPISGGSESDPILSEPPSDRVSEAEAEAEAQAEAAADDARGNLHAVGDAPGCEPSQRNKGSNPDFVSLRITYLIVTLVIMLADGLQGTHLYVLYEGYGFSVASLYCLGFVTGGFASPITGPLVDKLGRKKSAILYCVLEISINMLEQYPILPGLIISRMVGGVTTNLLSTVFDAWLDTEYRRRGLAKEGYEIIMRDSVIVSNLAAIGSGYLAHLLADRYGPVGPFEGAVTFTTIALIVVMFVWTENYGCGDHSVKGMGEFLSDAVCAFKSDQRILRVGVIQGLTCASIQIFIFLWSPALRQFAKSAPASTVGLDSNGEPAYGLIFGAFMAAGVLGGLVAPFVRKFASSLLLPLTNKKGESQSDRPMAVEVLSAICYCTSAVLLFAPCILPVDGTYSFSICLGAFLIYEFVVGLYLPYEGVIRSIYFPAEGRASIMTLPRIIVNCAVSLGVFATTLITLRSAFISIVFLMFVSSALQLSLVTGSQWSILKTRLLLCWRQPNEAPSPKESIETKPNLRRSSTLAIDDLSCGSLSSFGSAPAQQKLKHE